MMNNTIFPQLLIQNFSTTGLDEERKGLKGLYKTFWGTTKKCQNRKFKLIFILRELSEMRDTGRFNI